MQAAWRCNNHDREYTSAQDDYLTTLIYRLYVTSREE